MKLRDWLFQTVLLAWSISTVTIFVVVFVTSAGLTPEAFSALWRSLWIGVAVALPLTGLVAWRRASHIEPPMRAVLDMTQAMLSGRFRERFFPDTGTELDRLGNDLNNLASNLRSGLQDLRESNAKLAATLNASVSGIVIFDSEGAVSVVNQAAQAILGRTEKELMGLSFAVALVNADLASMVYRALYRRSPARQEVKVGRQEQRIVDATALPLLPDDAAPDASPSGVVLTFHDLTEIRRLEKMRTDFVQNVSHELRTPVTVVKGFAETLRDTPPDDSAAVREMAGLIEAEASRLSTLVGSLLDLSRLESGAVTLSRESVDPERILMNTARKLEPLAERKRQSISITAQVPPGSTLQADPSLIDMIFTNLLENAVKYTGDGGEIAVRVAPDDGGWLFSVSDNGPGISEQDLPHVFERFYRGSKDRSRDTGGSGLGLAIVKHAVTLHSGKVWVESRSGQGAAFYVWLP